MKKGLQKTRRPLSNFDRVMEMADADRVSLARRVLAEEQPDADRRQGCVERLKQILASGDTAKTQQIIAQARTDRLADKAVREYIAELLDRNIELSVQLRAFAVMYLVHPIAIMRRWADDD